MIRITDQYFWNFVFGIFFLILLGFAAIVIKSEGGVDLAAMTPMEFIILSLATLRFTRLFVYDHATKWLREQFWDAKKLRTGYVLEKPKTGPRRTLADLMSCPWCFGVWSATVVLFLYSAVPYGDFFILLLAVSGLGTFFQLGANLVGHQAEKLKRENGE
ncbi:DUF1360 domain-containing protein [Candidatus Kaiserbacteria bacterium]|nr:DUF1360 domain-containing protein [Candidatus Kaiserbacteria bacterium]MCB9811648.1 DUF1360 domain-containing protein [Candidatus Nomurabacteria bacterium]